MTTSKLKEDKTVRGEEYKGLREVEQKIEDLAIEEHRKEEEQEEETSSSPDDENLNNKKERDSSVYTEETDAQRRERSIRIHLQLLEHASYCNSSSKCSSSHCAQRKEELKHIFSCRQGLKGGCRHCKDMLNLIRVHATSCKTKNCKVPTCELVKEHLRKMQSEQQSKTEKPTAATDIKKNYTAPTSHNENGQKIEDARNEKVIEDDALSQNVKLLEHAFNCKSSKCSSSCADMKDVLKHCASCRNVECRVCVPIFGLTRVHALKCKTENCKIPRCEFVKQYSKDDLTQPAAKEAFEEFMIWSFSDKGDLNPKKFAKQASGISKLLIAGDISIQNLMVKRCQSLNKIEVETQEFEYRESMFLLTSGLYFHSSKYRDEFMQQLSKAFLKAKEEKCSNTPIHMVIYDCFQEVLSKWPNSNEVFLDDDCIFNATTKTEFDTLFSHILRDISSDPVKSRSGLELKNAELIHRYMMHPTARKEFLEKGKVYAQKLLISVVTLYAEMHSCWNCNQLHGKGNETKSLICAGCKCAVYCSKECQIEHWKDSHEECCEEINLVWSTFESRKMRVGKALKKEKIFTKQIIINGLEKECCLRPCAPLDYILCAYSGESKTNARLASMDAFYKNVATLSCGGKHLLFGDETISSQLEEKIKTAYEDVLSKFDPTTAKFNEVVAMKSTAEMLQYKESDLTKHNLMSARSSLSIDRFITLYICWEPFHLGKQSAGENLDKFEIEANLLKELQCYHDEME